MDLPATEVHTGKHPRKSRLARVGGLDLVNREIGSTMSVGWGGVGGLRRLASGARPGRADGHSERTGIGLDAVSRPSFASRSLVPRLASWSCHRVANGNRAIAKGRRLVGEDRADGEQGERIMA